ncbi:major histocompatibility complex class I-related gene protein-like [Scomber japonicus]|uniref:major histocompatibility complex class I-related gene protein-like n=1 Tax=Scomber japonicus TaxID=13676 RepID=UPI0023053EFA|nr:major histocompatibility complex class I-related gene protein-like [Scomber japonicus]
MYLIAVFVLLGTGLTVNSEKHSLMYIYTGLSKPVGLPGIHEFTAMGLLDGMMIDYYDNDIKEKVPKQAWMKEEIEAKYWEKGTQSRQSKQQWFKDSIDNLKKRINQTDDDLHVLQWMVGCEFETEPDGMLKFVRGVHMYNYDGQDFLYFDNAHSVWVAATGAAIPTKIHWNGFPKLKDYTKNYLEYECKHWLKKFMKYRKNQTSAASPPDVYVFAKKTRIERNITLTCQATGFYPKNITLNIKRNGHIVTKEDGLTVCPNEDDTYQIRKSVEILKSDISSFTCEVIHRASNMSVEKAWNHKVDDGGNNGGIIGGAIGGLVAVVLIAVVLVVLKKKGKFGGATPANGSNQSLNSDGTGSSGSGGSEVPKNEDVANPLLGGEKEKTGSKESLDSKDSGVSAGSAEPQSERYTNEETEESLVYLWNVISSLRKEIRKV